MNPIDPSLPIPRPTHKFCRRLKVTEQFLKRGADPDSSFEDGKLVIETDDGRVVYEMEQPSLKEFREGVFSFRLIERQINGVITYRGRKVVDENHHTWEESELFCPACGHQTVWIETQEADNYEGPTHLCVTCGVDFTLPRGPTEARLGPATQVMSTRLNSALRAIVSEYGDEEGGQLDR